MAKIPEVLEVKFPGVRNRGLFNTRWRREARAVTFKVGLPIPLRVRFPWMDWRGYTIMEFRPFLGNLYPLGMNILELEPHNQVSMVRQEWLLLFIKVWRDFSATM